MKLELYGKPTWLNLQELENFYIFKFGQISSETKLGHVVYNPTPHLYEPCWGVEAESHLELNASSAAM